MRKNKITVIGGAGHIGLPLSIVFANKGFDVAVLDKNKSAMEIAKKGIMPFREKDGVKNLKKALKKKIKFYSEPSSFISDSTVVITVGTPVDNFLNLDGFASLIDACDFIVTVDNSTIHISSALGKKSFLLLPYVADWRWLLDLQQSPWYPSLKIYRQKEINDWDSALENLKTDIENTTTNKFKS